MLARVAVLAELHLFTCACVCPATSPGRGGIFLDIKGLGGARTFRPVLEPVFWITAVPLHIASWHVNAGRGPAELTALSPGPSCWQPVGLALPCERLLPPTPLAPPTFSGPNRELLETRDHSCALIFPGAHSLGAGGGRCYVRPSTPLHRAHQYTFAEYKLLANGSILGMCSLPFRKHTVWGATPCLSHSGYGTVGHCFVTNNHVLCPQLPSRRLRSGAGVNST